MWLIAIDVNTKRSAEDPRGRGELLVRMQPDGLGSGGLSVVRELSRVVLVISASPMSVQGLFRRSTHPCPGLAGSAVAPTRCAISYQTPEVPITLGGDACADHLRPTQQRRAPSTVCLCRGCARRQTARRGGRASRGNKERSARFFPHFPRAV